MITRRLLASWMTTAIAMGLAACGGGGGGGAPAPLPTFSIGGAVTGLVGGTTLVVSNAGESLTVSANSSFTFVNKVAQNGSYSVAVSTQPKAQSCTITGATGSNVTANITSVAVTCAPSTQTAYVLVNSDSSIHQFRVGSDGVLLALNPFTTLATGRSPQSITVDPSNQFAFVTNFDDDTVSQYVVQADGTLAPNVVPTVVALQGPWALAIDPQGKNAYVIAGSGNTITRYTIGADGTLALAADGPLATGFEPWNVTLSPNGKYAYVSNHANGNIPGNTVNQYAIDATGRLSALLPATAVSGSFPSGSVIDGGNAFAYVTNYGDGTVSQYSVGTDGTLTALNPATAAAGSGAVYIARDPANHFAYVANFTPPLAGGAQGSGSVSQYTISTTGQLAAMPTASVPVSIGPLWINLDLLGRYAYVLSISDGGTHSAIDQFSIGADGSLSTLGRLTQLPPGVYAMAVAVTPQ